MNDALAALAISQHKATLRPGPYEWEPASIAQAREYEADARGPFAGYYVVVLDPNDTTKPAIFADDEGARGTLPLSLFILLSRTSGMFQTYAEGPAHVSDDGKLLTPSGRVLALSPAEIPGGREPEIDPVPNPSDKPVDGSSNPLEGTPPEGGSNPSPEFPDA